MVIRKKEKVSVNGLEELYEKTISTYARRTYGSIHGWMRKQWRCRKQQRQQRQSRFRKGNIKGYNNICR